MRSPNFNRSFHSKRLAASGLAALLLVTGGWLGGEVLIPTAVNAAPTRVDVTLDVLPGETFELLLHRAEAIARAATQRSFDRELLVNEVNVMIMAQLNGNLAPILSLQVSRENWRARPDPKIWSIYYRTSKTLLKLNAPATVLSVPTPTPTTASPLPTPDQILENELP